MEKREPRTKPWEIEYEDLSEHLGERESGEVIKTRREEYQGCLDRKVLKKSIVKMFC